MSMLPAVGEPFQGRTRCCEEDWGGSHYHCGHCGGVTGMYGHFVDIEEGNKWWKGKLPLPFRGFTCDPSTNEA